MDEPLWECPACGRRFANRNQTHTCASPSALDEHLVGCSADVIATYRALETQWFAEAYRVGRQDHLG